MDLDGVVEIYVITVEYVEEPFIAREEKGDRKGERKEETRWIKSKNKTMRNFINPI
ncbi:hypothetical protein [Bacillus rubiinfantis]|uniref:hypothetical protein n=1 Tax=Bacillus rubiinfantis TaxID=1499680 RepID=UPI001651F9BA|nr:hypothetical protein [Bacillus rubiinfantis]